LDVDAQHRQLVMLDIVAVPAFSDNYIWLVHDDESGATAVVDPGDGEAALAASAEHGWTIEQVWNTHRHADHTGGNLIVKAATGSRIFGPAKEVIPGMDVPLNEGDRVRLGRYEGVAWEVPGHTSGHIAIVFEHQRAAFVGDTLFAMGCGRLFEGTAEEMYHSLQRLASLPGDTRLYCAHEYTLSNARFAASAEPENRAVAARLRHVAALREGGTITLPTTVDEERATNPFVRASDAVQFAELRAQKDSFR
jgi:hydroxyacylglutathione hydrolase